MAEANWEKPQDIDVDISWEKPKNTEAVLSSNSGGRLKFLIGGLLVLGAVAYLILSGTATGARYFITVEELVNNPEYVGQTVRISGAVDGETIVYDTENLIIDFTIANIPEEFEDLAETLHLSLKDPNAARLEIRVENQVKPDLLQHEAQAILTGTLDSNGVFHATELLLKCPSRFEEGGPDQEVAEAQN